jgi:hypothetical protein
LVYQTDKEDGFYYWTGQAWKRLTPQEVQQLSDVAFTGSYNDLSRPTFSVTYNEAKTELSVVALTGNYNDLKDRPATTATRSTSITDYNDVRLINKPTPATVATTGNYNDLLNKPVFASAAISGDYSDLLNVPSPAAVAISGSYNDLQNTPTFLTRLQDFIADSGHITINKAERDYWNSKADVSDVLTHLSDMLQDENYHTTITRAERARWNLAATASSFSGSYTDLSGTPNLHSVALSGSYSDLEDKPVFTIISGDGQPLTLADVAFSGDYNDLKD